MVSSSSTYAFFRPSFSDAYSAMTEPSLFVAMPTLKAVSPMPCLPNFAEPAAPTTSLPAFTPSSAAARPKS